MKRLENVTMLDRWQEIIILFAVSLITLVVNNGVLPADIMESRNLVTAQEMVETGNYLVPTMNGTLRLEKPPLPTWAAAVVEQIAPGSLTSQRCLSALLAFLMTVFVYLIVNELTHRHRQAFFSALVLITTYSFIFMARNATWDIWCHSLMAGGIYYYIRAMQRHGAQYQNLCVAGVFFGLSFLAKGPVSFYALLLPFLLSYHFTVRPLLRHKAGALCIMLLLTLVVGGWWYGALYLFEQDKLMQVAHQESSAWADHSVRPWYYYKFFFAEAGIWALLWLTAIGYALFAKRMRHDVPTQFGLWWTLFALVLLSLVPEKKTRYLLPMMLPCALNIGSYLYYLVLNRTDRLRDRRLFRLNLWVILLLLLALPVGVYFVEQQSGNLRLSLVIIIAASCVFGAVSLLQSMRGRRLPIERVLGVIVLMMVVVTGLCLHTFAKTFVNGSHHNISALRTEPRVAHLPFCSPVTDELRIETVYAAGRRIFPLNCADSTSVAHRVPCVVISTQPLNALPALRFFPCVQLGRYDNNWRKKESKSYNPALVKTVWIVYPPQL
ncbi:MAG: glycosyltransferase family 39 protein [Bacteroidaceae bacterium]